MHGSKVGKSTWREDVLIEGTTMVGIGISPTHVERSWCNVSSIRRMPEVSMVIPNAHISRKFQLFEFIKGNKMHAIHRAGLHG